MSSPWGVGPDRLVNTQQSALSWTTKCPHRLPRRRRLPCGSTTRTGVTGENVHARRNGNMMPSISLASTGRKTGLSLLELFYIGESKIIKENTKKKKKKRTLHVFLFFRIFVGGCDGKYVKNSRKFFSRTCWLPSSFSRRTFLTVVVGSSVIRFLFRPYFSCAS